MESYQFFYLLLAIVIWIAGYFHTGRLVRPKWKIPGKFIFYITLSVILILWIEHYSLIFIIGHQSIGLIYHTKICYEHKINWWTCEPEEKYLEIQEKWAKEFSQTKINNK
jgi:hypothetical protein